MTWWSVNRREIFLALSIAGAATKLGTQRLKPDRVRQPQEGRAVEPVFRHLMVKALRACLYLVLRDLLPLSQVKT